MSWLSVSFACPGGPSWASTPARIAVSVQAPRSRSSAKFRRRCPVRRLDEESHEVVERLPKRQVVTGTNLTGDGMSDLAPGGIKVAGVDEQRDLSAAAFCSSPVCSP